MTPHLAQVFEAFKPRAKEGGKSAGEGSRAGAGGKVRLGTANGGLNGLTPPENIKIRARFLTQTVQELD